MISYKLIKKLLFLSCIFYNSEIIPFWCCTKDAVKVKDTSLRPNPRPETPIRRQISDVNPDRSELLSDNPERGQIPQPANSTENTFAIVDVFLPEEIVRSHAEDQRAAIQGNVSNINQSATPYTQIIEQPQDHEHDRYNDADTPSYNSSNSNKSNMFSRRADSSQGSNDEDLRSYNSSRSSQSDMYGIRAGSFQGSNDGREDFFSDDSDLPHVQSNS